MPGLDFIESRSLALTVALAQPSALRSSLIARDFSQTLLP